MADLRQPRSSVIVPQRWSGLVASYPAVATAYEALREACEKAGPLDGRTIALVKLSVSVGRNASRSVHRHAKKALRAGVPPAELRQAVLLALPTIGLPAALDAVKWVEESIAECSAALENDTYASGSAFVPAAKRETRSKT